MRTGSALAALALAALLPLGACQTKNSSSGNADGCHLAFMGSLPLTPERGHIAFTATINDQPSRLMFDTGAFSTLLTPAAAQRLDLRPDEMKVGPIEGVGGRETTAVFRARSVRIGNIQGRAYPFAVSDVGNLLAPGTDGIVGMDFFRYDDLDVDLPGRRLNLYEPRGDCTHPSAFLHGPLFPVGLLGAAPGRPYAADSTISQPRIHVTVNGVVLNAMMDTGAPHSVLFARGMDKLGDKAPRTDTAHVRAGGIGPNTRAAAVRILDEVTLGDLAIQHVPVAVIDGDMGDSGDMLLGLDFFRTIHVWISHSSGTVILQYPPQPSPLNPAALSGPAPAR